MPEERSTKATFIERMFDRFFTAQQKDLKGFFLVVLTIYAVWITRLYVNQNEVLNDRIVEEVRRQVPAQVKQEIEPLKQRVDTSTVVVKEMSSNIDSFIRKHE